MLNGVVALPYTRGHRQGAITATSEAQKTTESYMGETFSRRWELSKIKNTPEFQATRSLLDIFNQKGFFINPGTTQSGDTFNAMTLHGKIFVNTETQDPSHSMFFATGHELVHRLRQEHPDLYDKLYDVVAEESNNRDGILRKYAERYTELKGNNDKIFEEFVSDVMGDAFRDKGFWQKVYTKSPELFQKLIDILDSILKQLRFNASAHGIRHFIKDLERVHEVASDVMVEYAKMQNKGVGEELAFQKNQIEPNAIEEAKSVKLTKDKDGNLLAPNGEKSNLNEELWRIVRTPTFKKWFGDWEKDTKNSSKVIDENGEPLVVYHGTEKSFNEFSVGNNAMPNKNRNYLGSLGSWFTAPSTDSEYDDGSAEFMAGDYAGDKSGSNIMPVFLSIKNPLEYYDEEIYYDIPTKEGLEKKGYDGVFIVGSMTDGGVFRNDWVAFTPTQIKSIFNKGGFSLTDDRILEQKKTPTPTFFSQAQRVVGDRFHGKMASMSLVNWLKKNQVKEEEIYWLDIKSLTQGKKHVTREELQDWIQANKIDVQDVMKSEVDVVFPEDLTELPDDIKIRKGMKHEGWVAYWGDGSSMQGVTEETKEDAIREALFYVNQRIKVNWEKETRKDAPAHSQYQLPGEKDYRELVLTLPQQRKAGFMVRYKGSPSGEFDTRQEAEAYIIKVAGKHPTERQKYKIEGRLFEKGGVFTSPHYDEANILAHIRFNTRHDSDGNKVLFLEEIQSDWQAKGLDEGFHQKPELTDWAEIKDDSAITPDGAWYSTWNEHGYIIFKTDDGNYKTAVIADGAPEHNSGYVTRGTFKDVEQYILRSLKKTKSVPKAPFVSDKKGEASSEWIRLVMKRMLRYGAENGFDKISWTTGAQQIERWKSNLRQNVDQIHWQRGKGFSADQSAYLTKEEIKEAEITHVILNGIKNGNNVFSQTVPIKGEVTIEGQKVTLDRLLGKSMARKIRASKDRTGILDGDNLTIGGGVHKSIYDNAIPSIANKLGKQFGTKVGETEINKQANGLLFYDIVRADNNDPTIWASLDSKEKAEAEVKRLEEDPSKKYKINRAVLTQPSIDITPEMRESVMQGQPQFQRKGKEKPFRFDEKTGALPKGLYTSLLKIGNKKNRRHKDFWAGKSGDNKASDRAVEDLVKPEAIEYAKTFGKDAIFVPIVSKEGTGENQIPNALANFLALKTGAMLDTDIKHINKPEHTGKSVIHRIMNPLIFEGNVQKGGEYVLVDDTVATGGSLADLGQYLEENGGKVVGIMPLVNASRSGNLTPSKELLNELQKKFGKEIEQEFGIKLEALTYPEAYALNKFQSIDSIRKRVSLERKDKSDQRASGTLGQSSDNQSNLNKPQFQKADQNRPDFINHHLASVRPVKRLLLL